MLKVGSDCSGWASEVWALLKLGVNKFDHVFACDINRWSKKFIMANDPPKVWLDDVLAVDHHEQAPYVDVYVAGFPCQPFSAAGTNLGTKDARGKVIHGVMKYIEHRLPTIFVLENVKNLVSATHQEFFNKLIAWMRRLKLADGSLAYDVQWHVFNSKNFGVPQNRERVYIIGRRSNALVKYYDHQAFICNVMSHATSCVPSIRKFLNITGERPSTIDIRTMATSNIMRKNLTAAHTTLSAAGVKPHLADVVVDLASGQGLNMMHDLCPTITRTRGYGLSYFLTSATRRLTAFELCQLQGLQPSVVKWDDDMPVSAIGSLAGNAMTISVLATILREALLSTGLARSDKAGRRIVFP